MLYISFFYFSEALGPSYTWKKAASWEGWHSIVEWLCSRRKGARYESTCSRAMPWRQTNCFQLIVFQFRWMIVPHSWNLHWPKLLYMAQSCHGGLHITIWHELEWYKMQQERRLSVQNTWRSTVFWFLKALHAVNTISEVSTVMCWRWKPTVCCCDVLFWSLLVICLAVVAVWLALPSANKMTYSCRTK